jgi:hypothetical protein
MTNAQMNSETKHTLWRAMRHWNVCLHEAGHAVVYIRGRDTVVGVGINNENGGVTTLGGEFWKPFLPAAIVAGHVAELLWGYDTPPLGSRWCGSGKDFQDIARAERRKRGGQRILKIDRAAARKVWQRETRKLRVLAKRDPSFERQIKAVAKALSLTGSLTGDEIKDIMKDRTRPPITRPIASIHEQFPMTEITRCSIVRRNE